MSVADAIVVTFTGTVGLGAGIFYVVRLLRALWKLLTDLLAVMTNVHVAVSKAAMHVELVRGELSYMRQMTQAATGQEPQAMPQPPVGTVGRMPMAFPTRDLDTYPVVPQAPPAAVEDTDMSLLKQSDQELEEAVLRDEMRAKGLDGDIDDEKSPQLAVREEA